MILNLKPITGSIQPRDGAYYAVVNLYADGKRKQPWIDTGYSVKNGKIKAKQFLIEEFARVNDAREKIQQHFIKCGIVDQNELTSKTRQEIFSLVQTRRSSGVEIFDAKLQNLMCSFSMVNTPRYSTAGSGHAKILPDMLFLDYIRAWLPIKRTGEKPISEVTYNGYEIEGAKIEWDEDLDINYRDCPTSAWEKYFI